MNNDCKVQTEFLTGPAGCGKSFTVQTRREEDPQGTIIAATTGVAAVNLDTITINSLLRYYDTQMLQDRYNSGRLQNRLNQLARTDRSVNITIDEVSMLQAQQLDCIYDAIREVNLLNLDEVPGVSAKQPLSLTLTGDFCQLPPVGDLIPGPKGSDRKKWKRAEPRWAFQAKCWPQFAEHTNRLTKIWRQTDPEFLEAINAARHGNGIVAASGLRALGVEFAASIDEDFDGTTIVANNVNVKSFNEQRLARINQPAFALEAQRWGIQDRAWKNIEDRAIFRPTALVMILANKKYSEDSALIADSPYKYVNGDLAHVDEYVGNAWLDRWEKDEDTGKWKKIEYQAPAVRVVSCRTGESFYIERVTRHNTVKAGPDRIDRVYEIMAEMDPPVPNAQGLLECVPWYSEDDERWVVGSIDYFPIRLGYCSTVHKSQGLTIDRVQIDCRQGFFGSPSMAYVALSRARNIEGLRIVGNPALLASRIKLHPMVREWL